MISSVARARILVLVVFLVGTVVGALLDNTYETRWKAEPEPARRSQREVSQIYDLLNLSAEQRQEWQAIVEASRPEFERLFEENRKLLEPNQRRYAELQEETRSKIRAILTEDQREKYNEYNDRRARQRRQNRPVPE